MLFVLPGAHQRGGPGGPGPSPWGLKSTRFSGFLPLYYMICVFATRVLKLFAMWKDQEACSMVKSLRKVYFSHPTGHYLWKFLLGPSPWENPGCAPAFYHRYWFSCYTFYSCIPTSMIDAALMKPNIDFKTSCSIIMWLHLSVGFLTCWWHEPNKQINK